MKELLKIQSGSSPEMFCKACNFIEKKISTQVFSCDFCKIFKNTFFTECLQWLLLVMSSVLISTSVFMLKMLFFNSYLHQFIQSFLTFLTFLAIGIIAETNKMSLFAHSFIKTDPLLVKQSTLTSFSRAESLLFQWLKQAFTC